MSLSHPSTIGIEAVPHVSQPRYQTAWNALPWPLQKVILLTLEIGKITLATSILSVGSEFVFPVITKDIIHTVIIGPFSEEIIFRGFMQNSIRLIQMTWNWYCGQGPTEAQQMFRVRFTGIVFGAFHLLNQRPLSDRIIQSVSAGIGGIAYGYLAEITGTLATTILLHGLNNGLCIAPNFALISSIHASVLLLFLELSNHYIVHHGGYLPTYRHLSFQMRTWTHTAISYLPTRELLLAP